MAKGPGREQKSPMERLVRLIVALNHAEFGSPMEQLIQIASSEGNEDAQKRQVKRDINHLNKLGYDISTISASGGEGVYKMRARDNRLQVALSAEQRAELLRAAVLGGWRGWRRILEPAPAPAEPPTLPRMLSTWCSAVSRNGASSGSPTRGRRALFIRRACTADHPVGTSAAGRTARTRSRRLSSPA